MSSSSSTHEPRRKLVSIRNVLLPEVVLPLFLLGFIFLLLKVSQPWANPRSSPVQVVYKRASELAKIKPSPDAYPCLVVERQKPDSALHAEIRSCLPSLPNTTVIEQYQVFLPTGYFAMLQTDLFVPDRLPLVLTRGYRHWYSASEAFGTSGILGYDIHPFGDRFPYTYMQLVLPDGNQIAYHRISQGTSYVDDVQEHAGTPLTIFDRSRIWWNRDHWDMKFVDGTMYRFPEAYYSKRPAQGALVGMHDPSGGSVAFVRDKNGNLLRVTSSGHHWIEFSYNKSDRIFLAKDDAGHAVSYSYDELGRLSKVTKNDVAVWSYAYDPTGLTAIKDALGKTILTNHYEKGRIESLTLADGKTYHFDYLFDQRGNVVETYVRDPKGKPIVFRF